MTIPFVVSPVLKFELCTLLMYFNASFLEEFTILKSYYFTLKKEEGKTFIFGIAMPLNADV